MKTLILILISVSVLFAQSDSVKSKFLPGFGYFSYPNQDDANVYRYFMCTYIIIENSTHRYGDFYFSTSGTYFPSKKEVRRLLIKKYKIPVQDTSHLTVCLHEFKNRSEWLKFNKK